MDAYTTLSTNPLIIDGFDNFYVSLNNELTRQSIDWPVI